MRKASFDGMTDCYHYDPTLTIDKEGNIAELGGAKYVFANRDVPRDLELRMLHDLGELLGKPFLGDQYQLIWPEQGWNPEHTFQTLLHRILQRTDLTAGYHGIRRTDVTCGSYETFYEIF
jgi:hypothetical protein